MRFRYESLEATADISEDYLTTSAVILEILRREFPDVIIRKEGIVSPRKRKHHSKKERIWSI